MRSFQYKYERKDDFSYFLDHIKSECGTPEKGHITFYMTWDNASRNSLVDLTACIERKFPDAICYGCEASGSIVNGNLEYGIAVTCFVFDEPDTAAKLVWVEKDSVLDSLDDLWRFCRKETGLKAVELIPSIRYLDVLKIENSVPDIADDILVFGGASVNYDNPSFEAEIFATGHGLTQEGMAVVLYYGENLSIHSSYVLGWKGLGRQMKVTESRDKNICKIDGMPACSIYEKYLNVGEDDNDNLVFPLIVKEDGVEYIRTPQLFLPDKSMQMFVNIPEGSLTRIAYGDKNTILSSLYEKVSEISSINPCAIKSFSCAARRLFWGDDEVSKETLPLQEIAPVSGFYTGGEILRFGKKLRVLNSTLVIISFCEGNCGCGKIIFTANSKKTDKSLVSRLTYFAEKIVEEQEKQKVQLARRTIISNYFLKSYLIAYYCNLETGMAEILQVKDESRNYLIGHKIAFDQSVVNRITRTVHPDDKSRVLLQFERDNIKKTLKDVEEFSFNFSDNEEKATYRCTVIRGDDENHVGIGFMDITEELRIQKEIEEQKLLRKLGTVNLSSDIFTKSNIGLWAFELDEGCAPKMYVNDAMLGLIGLDHQVSPEETYHAWYDHIDENSYSVVNDAVEKMSMGEHAEVQYPWHHPDGHIMTVRCGGVRNFEYKTGIRIEGIHQNVTEVIHFDEEEIERLKAAEVQLRHEKLRGEVLKYMIDNDDDPIELLKNYAESLRVLFGCDQVIYRDLEETRIMINSPDIEKTWSVPMEYCLQCQHFDAHHPMYAGGYTEMNNCQEGWQGIPVYHKCPIKSSLTRIVYCDGEVAGYLAIHYVQKYHTFSEAERNTLEEFTRILSISLSRYEAKKTDKEKKRYDILHEIIHSGKWSFYVNSGDEIVGVDYSEEVMKIVNNDYSEKIHDWLDVVHPQDVERVRSSFRATIEDHTCNTPYDETFRMADRNGEYHWFHSAGRIVRDEFGSGEFFGIHIDITEQVEKQEKQQQRLEEALATAQVANKAKTDFLFNMSHDIRTPMNAIVGFTNMAIKHIDDKEKVIDSLEKTKQSSDLLLSLINSILDMSRIESGKATVEENKGDVTKSFASIECTMKELAKTKDLDLKFEIGNVTDRYIYYDHNRCIRVFVNIISNAVKYTPDGGIIRVRCDQIGSKNGIGTYRYTFSDTGIGMSEEFQKHVFEEFAREKNSTTSGIQGTGLGLSVCKSFTELMGGTIECQSKQGIGTIFVVTLPLKIRQPEADEETETEAENESHISDVFDFNGKKVLLVEDNELNREIAMDILDEEGISVDEADDGSVAVEMLREKGPDCYDFVLMDIQMPTMNGYDATKAIRAMYPESKLPIIALSANAFAEDKAASVASGMNDHVAKPINIEELKTVLAKYI